MSTITIKQFSATDFHVRFTGKGQSFPSYADAMAHALALQSASGSDPKPEIKEFLL